MGIEEVWILESEAFHLEAPGLRRTLPRLLDERCLASGDGSSADVRWGAPPPGTRSLAVLFEREQPSFCQWLVYNIPPELRHLPPGIPPQESLPNGICQGVHSGGRLGYLSPARDLPGRAGRLRAEPVNGAEAFDSGPLFRLSIWALATPPELRSRLNREGFLTESAGKVLGEAVLWTRLPREGASARPKGHVA